MQSLWKDITYFVRHSPGRLNKLIALNVLLFVVAGLINVVEALFGSEFSIYEWQRSNLGMPASVQGLAARPWAPFTYMFLHDGFFHMLFNMLWFYWFGRLFEEYLGYVKILWLYLLSGLAGAALYMLFYNIFPVYAAALPTATAVGASAAVMGVVAASATLLPNYSFHLLFFGPVKIKYIAIAYFVLDVIGIGSTNSGGHISHIGGAILGFVFIRQLQRGNDWGAKLESIFVRSDKKKQKMKVVVNNPQVKREQGRDAASQEEIDAILDKISANGYDSLTAKEKELLFKASKK